MRINPSVFSKLHKRVRKIQSLMVVLLPCLILMTCYNQSAPKKGETNGIDPTTLLWYQQPADKWENALPVGNGRLGAMVFGGVEEERIQFNEETYWSGGPYSQTVNGSYRALPEIQKLIFQGKYIQGHQAFGRSMMGYPIEQMKYQSMGNLILSFGKEQTPKYYKHQLDIEKAIVTTSYQQNGIQFNREVFITPVDQVLVIHISSDTPKSISFRAQLRGNRNQAHSNYATDYFQMDSLGSGGLQLRGKSADYLGVEGKIRYLACLKVYPEDVRRNIDFRDLVVKEADAVTLYLAAATNFVNYKDVSANSAERVEKALKSIENKSYEDVKKAHIEEYQRYFRRVKIKLGSTPNSFLPTDERIQKFSASSDPDLAALCVQFARYMLISSSRPGTQPANLQGIWNESMNPSWDSKYTTNINTQMNYWPAEVGNLSEFSQPLFQMIKELTDQGSDVAREHYAARGWVHHQNTDLWRVAAPMDGPDWGTFTAGGAWLCIHLWEHYLFTGDKQFLEDVYPIMKGSVEFFLDFLVKHPTYGWLVTNPSTSPENFPGRPDNDYFFDEATGWMSPGTTICAGSTVDMQILSDLFDYTLRAAAILDKDREFREKVLVKKRQLAPMQIGKEGDLQEWLEDWPQKEDSHRHISHLYGLYPGNQISLSRTPQLAQACAVVLEQRGLEGNGWASAWKMACWARLGKSQKAIENLAFYLKNYTYQNLYAICAKSLQVDGMFGVSAALNEMLLQSHQEELYLLPCLPQEWKQGKVEGLCARGGFEVDMIWDKGVLQKATILSKDGLPCRVRTKIKVEVYRGNDKIDSRYPEDTMVEFDTDPNTSYTLISVE